MTIIGKPFKNEVGNRYGRLVVLERAEDKYFPSGRHGVQYLCQCDCGNAVIVYGEKLRKGEVRSCGCLRKEIAKESFTTHGLSKERIYSIWKGMMGRCLNERCQGYKWYGARGITVCDEWRSNPQAFKDWALSNGYEEHLTLDRIDVNGDYCPENCRWATAREQANNKRTSHKITLDGVTKTRKQWADEFNHYTSTIINRVNNGWNEEEAITVPSIRPLEIDYDGETHSVKEWSEILGVSVSTIYYRYKRGYDLNSRYKRKHI